MGGTCKSIKQSPSHLVLNIELLSYLSDYNLHTDNHVSPGVLPHAPLPHGDGGGGGSSWQWMSCWLGTNNLARSRLELCKIKKKKRGIGWSNDTQDKKR